MRPDLLYVCWVITLIIAALYLAKLLLFGLIVVSPQAPQLQLVVFGAPL